MSSDTNIESAHSQSSEFEDSGWLCFPEWNLHYTLFRVKTKEWKSYSFKFRVRFWNAEKRRGVFWYFGTYSNKITDLERIYKISYDDYKKAAEDVQKPDIDEDSQQEYHSAEEQECINNHLSFGLRQKH